MNRRQRIERLQKLPPEKRQVVYFIRYLFYLWLVVAFFFFLSGEAIFILPTFVLAGTLSLLRIYYCKTIVMQGKLTYLLWSLFLALFSYLSSIDVAMRPVFPILCLFFGCNVLIACWGKRSLFIAVDICIWLMCMGVAFFFGFWPVGLIAIGVSFLLSIINEMTALRLFRFVGGKLVFVFGKPVTKVQMASEKSVEMSQEEVQMPESTFVSHQVPGQQYQPLLPEYDSSLGPYIQDLPRE